MPRSFPGLLNSFNPVTKASVTVHVARHAGVIRKVSLNIGKRLIRENVLFFHIAKAVFRIVRSSRRYCYWLA